MSSLKKENREFKLKQIGQNLLIVTPDGKSLSKRFEDKDERENIKILIQDYNNRNSQKKERSIISAFTINADKKAAEKSISRNISKRSSKTSIKSGKADGTLKSTTAKKVAAKTAQTTPAPTPTQTVRRRGEY